MDRRAPSIYPSNEQAIRGRENILVMLSWDEDEAAALVEEKEDGWV